MKKKKYVAAALALAVLIAGEAWQGPRVIVWARHHGGQVVYSYEVQNVGLKPVKRFWIGRKIAADGMNGEAELTVAPLSANPTFWLSSDVGQTPAGWGINMRYEESSAYSLECIEADYFARLWPSAPVQDAPRAVVGGSSIPPGTTLGGFIVTVPQEDLAYVRGNATFSNDSGFFSVPVIRGDTASPAIALNVARLNQNDTNGQWAIFNVSYEVSDNYDPLPTIAFQLSSSPTASAGEIVMEKNGARAWNVKVRNVAGRVYTFRVQTSDASGNVATKTYTYAVAPATR